MTNLEDDEQEWFDCPYHHGPIVVPCALKHCDLWISNEKHLSCSYIAYKQVTQKLGTDDLNWKAIGTIVEKTSDEVERLAKEAYEQVRQEAVQSKLAAEWSMVRDSKQCVVCNRPASIFEKGWGWCSDACKTWLPLAAVEAEARWGVKFVKLLSQWKNLSLKTIERITGLDKQTIQWLMWQHLGYREQDKPKQWRKQDSPLVPNPQLPTNEELLGRLRTARMWDSE